MFGIDNVVNLLRIIPKPLPPPPPKPKPELPEPAEDLNAKIADQRQQELQFRNKLERLEQRVPPILRPAIDFVGDALEANPSAELIGLIARKNAPILILPTGSSLMPNVNLPADPEEYIANSRLRENVPAGVSVSAPDWNPFNGVGNPFPVSVRAKDETISDNTNSDSSDDFTSEDVGGVTNEKYYLDLNNEQRGQLGSMDAPIFYQYEAAKNGEPPKLTYHIFYGYNDAPAGGPTSNTKFVDLNHEGDWERVTYELDPETFEPTSIVPSAHNGSSEPILFPETGRPQIYVATGSHANYAAPGTKPLQFNAADQTAIDQNGDGAINAQDGAIVFDAARNLQEVTSQSWYPGSDSGGLLWGEIGTLENVGNPFGLSGSGPRGPSYDKGAVE